MVMWPVWSNGNIEGTTCRIGDDKSGYLAFHCGGNFNIGCNANTTIGLTYIGCGLDALH